MVDIGSVEGAAFGVVNDFGGPFVFLKFEDVEIVQPFFVDDPEIAVRGCPGQINEGVPVAAEFFGLEPADDLLVAVILVEIGVG